MEYMILGFMVTDYVKSIGLNGDSDMATVRAIVNAHVNGYLAYVRDDVEHIGCSVRVTYDNKLMVYVGKEFV